MQRSDSDWLPQLHQIATLGVRHACGVAEAEAQFQALQAELPATLQEPSGVFVTLTKKGQLRGCIGYPLPHKPLPEALFESGYNAAARDPRFAPLQAEELKGLEVTINLLTPPQSIPSIEQFIVGEHGIVLRKGGHSALFLPEVASEQGWDREQTLNHLAVKAGLPADGWREGAQFAVFWSVPYCGGV